MAVAIREHLANENFTVRLTPSPEMSAKKEGRTNVTPADYRGARSSNAGDNFHELWAARQTLRLLDPESGLVAVTLEGVSPEDEAGTRAEVWDGVDCALYYGDTNAKSAEKVELVQLKYSAATPQLAWTIARLTSTTNKQKTNSVLGRLAQAFTGLPDGAAMASAGRVKVRLISNQPVDAAVVAAFQRVPQLGQDSSWHPSQHDSTKKLWGATGLSSDAFRLFSRVLDLSECGKESRFDVEERVLATIAGWIDDDARSAVSSLLYFIRKVMLPEAKGTVIKRENILLHLGVADPAALFPCPPAIKRIDSPIPREDCRAAAQVIDANQRTCLHGEGGCGKTTALQEIGQLLPPESTLVVFDCFGGGRYLDSDAYRHRSREAFVQLSNDLCRRLGTPLLINLSSHDPVRAFKRRLDRAAEVVTARDSGALLVIAVDAADNSIIAGEHQSPPERSFVHDFMALGELPPCVRLVVTTRTGRLDSLKLSRDFKQQPIHGFARDETGMYVRSRWPAAPDAWLDDFHHLSRGNPRVQSYALDFAQQSIATAIDFLRPNGKSLDQVFGERFHFALQKSGDETTLALLCATLVALPRPVPIADLAAVTGTSEARIRDLCNDLAPGVRFTDSAVGFADEDFEHFVRDAGQPQRDNAVQQIAVRLEGRHKTDAYAAMHVAHALFTAGRGRAVIDLINAEREPLAIGDPVLRREAQLHRLRIAMKVCRESGDTVDAVLTLLIGAEALKTDATIRRTLIANPDLAAAFARDTSARMILRDPQEIEHHGALLFHLMAADSRDRDVISVREGHRLVRAWLTRRAEDRDERKREHPNFDPHAWSIEDDDIVAETEALLRTVGVRRALDGLDRWRPRNLGLRVATRLASTLIASGDADLVRACVQPGGVKSPWDLFLLVPLALAGDEVDLTRVSAALQRLARRRLVRFDQFVGSWRDDDFTARYYETIVTACELVVARGGSTAVATEVLSLFTTPEARRRDRMFPSQVNVIDLSLRAHVLIERLAGRVPTLESFWVDPPAPLPDATEKQVNENKQQDARKQEELCDFIGPMLPIYDSRAQALCGMLAPDAVTKELEKTIAHARSNEYRLRREHYAGAFRARVATSITRLLVLGDVAPSALLKCAAELVSVGRTESGATESAILGPMLLVKSLHGDILARIATLAASATKARSSASDKVDELLRLSRLVRPISRADAESLFNRAIEVAGELDHEAVHELALFAPLAERGSVAMDTTARRAVATELAVVVGDAGVRLAGQDGFPWEDVARALTILEPSVAFAVAARWEDEGLGDRSRLLPTILGELLRSRSATAADIVALLPLLDSVDVELIAAVVDRCRTSDGDPSVPRVIEELARDELLRFGGGRRVDAYTLLAKVGGLDTDDWMRRLSDATAFHQLDRPSHVADGQADKSSGGMASASSIGRAAVDDVDWSKFKFVTSDEIVRAYALAYSAARRADTFPRTRNVFATMAATVAPGDRVAHLESLALADLEHVMGYEWAQAIAKRIDEWLGTPAVDDWCRTRLPQVISDRLPDFAAFLGAGGSSLPSVLQAAGLAPATVREVLLGGMERHVDDLDAVTVYGLIGILSTNVDADDAGKIASRYARRLMDQIPAADRDVWDVADIPHTVSEGIARFLYALLGDVDVRIRWRAAHALRRFAIFGQPTVVDHAIQQYTRTVEPSFRAAKAPFYWLAARLWLIVTLDRIADECGAAIVHQIDWLISVACDQAFPHVLVRQFAKTAVIKLDQRGRKIVSVTDRRALKNANVSPFRRKVRQLESQRAPRNSGVGWGEEKRRFHFDWMDTLPYWYSDVLGLFDNLDGKEFLDVAERWIVDGWGVVGEVWRWDQEPRQDRFSERTGFSMDHRHGSMPTVERYDTYLEWHAMWCASGELLKTHPLLAPALDTESWESWVSDAGLSVPPLWLADLRSPKPLNDRFWFAPPAAKDIWLGSITDIVFRREIELEELGEMLTIACYHDTRSEDFANSVRVESALVTPTTAHALVRALQSAEEPHSYCIPPAGDRLEVVSPPYSMRGWLWHPERSLGMDQRDPLRYNVKDVCCQPSDEIIETLGLSRSANRRQWMGRSSGMAAFQFEEWGDVRDDEDEDRFRYDKTVRSNGWRLRVRKEVLTNLLLKTGNDLIVEVAVTRKSKGYEHYRADEEEEAAQEARFVRILLLRSDGTVEGAEGCVGTWTSPGSRARP